MIAHRPIHDILYGGLARRELPVHQAHFSRPSLGWPVLRAVLGNFRILPDVIWSRIVVAGDLIYTMSCTTSYVTIVQSYDMYTVMSLYMR